MNTYSINKKLNKYCQNLLSFLAKKYGFNEKEVCNEYEESIKKPKQKPQPQLKTEDTGKQFEMAICLTYGIAYNGNYKYDMELPQKLKIRLSSLVEQKLFPMCKHTANKGARYDFTSIENDALHLSAKTTKKGVGMVAPQVIGQPSPQKFCDIVGFTFSDVEKLKYDIQSRITIILPFLVNYTFDSDTLYYNKDKDSIRYIKMVSPILWDKHTFTWSCYASVTGSSATSDTTGSSASATDSIAVADANKKIWNNSSTLKIKVEDKYIDLVEFQFHTKSRKNMAIRWFYENVLSIFKDNFNIINL